MAFDFSFKRVPKEEQEPLVKIKQEIDPSVMKLIESGKRGIKRFGQMLTEAPVAEKFDTRTQDMSYAGPGDYMAPRLDIDTGMSMASIGDYVQPTAQESSGSKAARQRGISQSTTGTTGTTGTQGTQGAGGGQAGAQLQNTFMKGFSDVSKSIAGRMTKAQAEGTPTDVEQIAPVPTDTGEGPQKPSKFVRGLGIIGQALSSAGQIMGAGYGPGQAQAIGQASKALQDYIAQDQETAKQQALAEDMAGGELPYGTSVDEVMKMAMHQKTMAEARQGVKLTAAQTDKYVADTIATSLGIELDTPSEKLGGFSPNQTVDLFKLEKQLIAAKERAKIAAGETQLDLAKKQIDFTNAQLQATRHMFHIANGGMDPMTAMMYALRGEDPRKYGVQMTPQMMNHMQGLTNVIWGKEIPIFGGTEKPAEEAEAENKALEGLFE